MSKKDVYLYVHDGFADWEPAHALAEVRRTGGYAVKTVSLDGRPVVSMGGLRVMPDLAIEQVDPESVAIFILPGGESWVEQPVPEPLAELLKTLNEKNVPLAAICAATVAIARLGLLGGRRHTSNALEFLQGVVPEYNEAENYVDEVSVRDRGLITASGLGDVEFAADIFAELNVMDESTRAGWRSAFRTAQIPPGFFG
ncbi:MAG: type 1 glutamine amidotransferase family protein [Planctomycetia bacterium]|jgi:putative intracellular protease/amidase